jgi:predicted permease
MPSALFYLVTPGYQSAMRIPLERGRFITAQDDQHAPAVVLIDSTFARKFFPNQDPIGKHINLSLLDVQPEIIGVMGHVEHWGLGNTAHQDLQAQIYLPVWQVPDRFWPLLANGSNYVARTAAAPMGSLNAIRAAAQKFDPTAVVYEPRPMEEVVANSIATKRFSMILLSVFAALALLLSAVGIYGVVSYLVGQRLREIGLRMALGAQRSDVLRLVLGEGAKMALIGVGFGLAGALLLTRFIRQLLYGVSATDPITFVGVAAVLTIVALAACYFPARRAMRVDPIVALRYE